MSKWQHMDVAPPPSRGKIDIRSASVTLFDVEWRDGYWRNDNGYAICMGLPLKQVFPEWRPAEGSTK